MSMKPYRVRIDTAPFRSFAHGPAALAFFLDSRIPRNGIALFKCRDTVTATKYLKGIVTIYRRSGLALFKSLCRDDGRKLSITNTIRGNKYIVYCVRIETPKGTRS